MNTSEALRLRNDSLEFLQSKGWLKWTDYVKAEHATYTTANEVMDAMPEIVRDGTLYWSTPAVDKIISVAARTLPEVTITPDLLLSQTGLWVYSEPFQGRDDLDEDESAKLITAVGWRASKDRKQLWLIPMHTIQGMLVPSGEGTWNFGRTINEEIFWTGENQSWYGVALRNFLAAQLFAKQKILSLLSDRPSRALRRSAERKSLSEPEIRVVSLRARERSPADSDSEPMDWSCHWVVGANEGGHWRQQYYPSENIHRPIWIMPYTKGDLDKPFKPPTSLVYTVNR